jgi:hypothetical protein
MKVTTEMRFGFFEYVQYDARDPWESYRLRLRLPHFRHNHRHHHQRR